MVLLALVLLAGCTSTETDAPTPTSPSGGLAPASEHEVAGVVLTTPEGWQALELAPPDATAEQVAGQLGLEVGQLEDRVGAEELFLVASGEHTVVPTLEAYVVPGRPTVEEVQADFTDVGGDVRDVAREDTEVGEVLVVLAGFPTDGSTLEAATAVVRTGGRSLVLAVRDTDRDAAEETMRSLVESLRDA